MPVLKFTPPSAGGIESVPVEDAIARVRAYCTSPQADGIRMTGLHVRPVSTGYSMTSPPGRSSGLSCSTGSLEPRTSWASTGRCGTGSLRGYQPSEVVDSESWMIWTWRRS